MGHEYELISHEEVAGFRVFLVDLLYRTPHNHKDIELCLLLRGKMELVCTNGTFSMQEKDSFLMNSFEAHELRAETPALLLCLQVSPDFFAEYYPRIIREHFRSGPILWEEKNDRDAFFEKVITFAMLYFRKEPYYELRCAAGINEVLYSLLTIVPHEPFTKAEFQRRAVRQTRLRFLTDTIDRRYSEKLLLADLAEEMQVSMYYLSHFFKECFSMSFQEYLSRVRCEKARRMLLLTDRSLLDISMECGFSAQKYFNRAFHALYGCSPKEYRRGFVNSPLPVQQKSVLTTQEFLSREASLVQMDQYLQALH